MFLSPGRRRVGDPTLAAKNAATMGQPAPTAQPAKDEDGSGGKNSEREDGKAEAAHTAKEALVTG